MEEIAVIEVLSQQVMGITRTGTYQLIPELLMEVYEYCQKEKIAITGVPMFICHETSPDAVREAQEKGTAVVEVVWPVSGSVAISGRTNSREEEWCGPCTVVRTRHANPQIPVFMSSQRLIK